MDHPKRSIKTNADFFKYKITTNLKFSLDDLHVPKIKTARGILNFGVH
eukprot:UN02818